MSKTHNFEEFKKNIAIDIGYYEKNIANEIVYYSKKNNQATLIKSGNKEKKIFPFYNPWKCQKKCTCFQRA